MPKFRRLLRMVALPIMLLAMLSVPLAHSQEPAGDEDIAAVTEPEHTENTQHVEDADHPHEAPLLNFDVGAAIWNLLIFGSAFAILAFFVWPPILKGLQAREDQIRGDLEGAEQARLQAETLRTDLDKQISDAQSQVQAMLADARRDAESAGQKIVEDAKSEAERQRQRAIADIETAKKVALSEMAVQTSEIAMTLAKQVVGRELNANDHAELIRQSLERLPSNN